MVMQTLDEKRISNRGITWILLASTAIGLAGMAGALSARSVPNVHPAPVTFIQTAPASLNQAQLVAAAHHLNTAWYKALTPGALLVDDTGGGYGVHKLELTTIDMHIETDSKTGAILAVTYSIDVMSSGNACSRHANAKPRYSLGPGTPTHSCGFLTPEEALKATKGEDFVGGAVPVSFQVTYVPDGKTLRLARTNPIFTEIMAPHLRSGFTPTRSLMKRLYAYPIG